MSIEETVQHIIASQENNRKIYDDNKKKNYKNKPRSNARKAEHQKYEAETNLASKDKKNNDDDNDDNNMIKEFVKERPNTNNVSKQLHKTNKRHSAYTNRFANSEHERESHQNNNVISLPSSPSYSMSSTSPTYTSSLSLASHSAARKAQVSNSHALLLDEVQLDEMQRAIKPNSSNSNAPIASLYTSPTSNLFTSMESPMTCEPLANDLIHTERSKTASSPPVSPLLRRPHTANENNVKSGEHQTTISVNMDHENNNNNNFNKTKEQANTSAHGIMCSNALFHRRFAMSFPTLMRQLARIAVHIGYNESINDALEVFYARMYVQCAEIQRKAIYYSKVTDTDVNRANNHRKKEQKQEEQKEEEEVKRQREGEMVSEKVKQETQNEKNTNIIEQASEHVQEIHEEQSECTTTSSNEECNDNHSYCHSNNNNNTIHGKLQETSEGETDEVMLVPNDKCTFTHSESQPAKRTLVHSLSQMMFSLPTSQPTLSPSPLSPSSSSQTGVKTTSMKEKKVHNQQQQQQQQQLGSVNIDFFALDEMCLLFDMLPSA